MSRVLALIPLLVLVTALVAACDGGGQPTPAATPTAGSTPAPSPPATPSPTPSPTAPAATPTPTPEEPTATPTQAAPTPTPTPAATQPPVAGLVLEHGPRDSSLVALTFDMGGRVEPALDIMAWLIANRVRSTIFMTGAMAENPNTDAGREVLRLIEAHPELFDLANHSYTHPDFRELSEAEIRDELLRTEAAVAPYTSSPMRPLFRPPYGGQDARVVAAVAAAGYPYTVMWDIDTIDWRPVEDGGPSAEEIAAKVLDRAQGGSIVLMHLGGYHTLDALPAIVEGLRARGYEFGTVRDLLGGE